MLEHLDDPNPPRPSGLVVERIAAEGARRLRHRRIVTGGALVVTSTLAVVGMAVALQPDLDGDKVDTIGPSDTTTTSTTEAPDDLVVTDTTPTTVPATDDSASGPPISTGPSVSSGPADDDIAAVVKDPGADRAQVVLLDPSSGEITRTLAGYDLLSRPPLCCIDRTDNGRDVYYVVPAGQGDGAAGDTIWHVGLDGGQPAPVATGTSPAASPDGSRLALVRTTADGPAVVVRDLATGEEQAYPAAVDDFLRDVEWFDADTLVVTRQQPEAPLVAYELELDGSATSLADAARLGPTEDAPAGTSWEWVDRRADGWLTAVQTCCALDAASTDGANETVLVDPVSGAVTGGSGLPSRVAGLAGSRGDEGLLVIPPPGAPGYGRLQVLTNTDLTDVPGDHEVIAADW